MQEIKDAVKSAVKELFNVEVEPELTRPEEKFGDYSTNVAMQLAGKSPSQPSQNPRQIAENIADRVKGLSSHIKQVSVAGPGFINVTLTDEFLAQIALEQKIDKPLQGQTIVAEYSDPNPFKELHAGHLYTSVVGDAISNLFAAAGANVQRVNFGGDVGLHVAKTMWGVLLKLGGENQDRLKEVPEPERSAWLSEAYVRGNTAYLDDNTAKPEIVDLNKRIYQIVNDKDQTSPLAQIYWTTRRWSYDYFEDFYKQIGTKFDKYYPESETIGIGMQTVKDNLGKVFEQSDGAVIFKGEVHNLHTRVFINSEGLPTYETKDVGLSIKKWQDYHFDKSVIITANEIFEYMQVVLKAIEQIQPELAQKTVHLTHGLVKLKGGEKMSSRKGNVLRAIDVLAAAADANQKAFGKNDKDVELGAIKYAFIKQRIGGDIIYDPEESVSLQGNSGPYIQYAYARARSILSKAQKRVTGDGLHVTEMNSGERSLVRKISEYPEVVQKAVQELMPHYISTYLYELAQTFNRFYENNRVIGDRSEQFRLKLVEAYADTLKNGLSLLNISAPEKM